MSNLPSIEYLSLGIRTNDPIYSNGFIWKKFFDSFQSIQTFILGLEIEINRNLLFYLNLSSIDHLIENVFQSFHQHFSSYPINIYKNNRILYIDSIPYRKYRRKQIYKTCPQLHFGIRSNENLFKENPKGILGLAIIGEHYPIEINDYIQLINYFQNIQWIYFDSIHITNQHLLPILHLYPLNSLKTLIYMRSTFCKIHRDFFEKLFLNQNNFKTLKIMYGDLIYYLKQSNEIPNGKHIENLVLFLCGADGQFRLIHLNYFILTFPLLKSLTIEINSKNLFRKNQLEIIKEILHSFQYLQSLKIICRKGNLHFTSSIISNLSQSFASF
ncbi:unnamed protein product, partial [Adineta ricciae]